MKCSFNNIFNIIDENLLNEYVKVVKLMDRSRSFYSNTKSKEFLQVYKHLDKRRNQLHAEILDYLAVERDSFQDRQLAAYVEQVLKY